MEMGARGLKGQNLGQWRKAKAGQPYRPCETVPPPPLGIVIGQREPTADAALSGCQGGEADAISQAKSERWSSVLIPPIDNRRPSPGKR